MNTEFTPVQKLDGVLCKRDDLFSVAGIAGGKVRTCQAIITKHPLFKDRLANGVGCVTASARQSPQMQIVSRVAEMYGMPTRCHMPQGAWGEEMKDAVAHRGEIIQHRAGYNSVIRRRATDDAEALKWIHVPFGMEHKEAIAQTRKQVQNLAPYKEDIDRIVIPVGSGMSLAGLLWGLQDLKWFPRILGVQVGADPFKRLMMYGPPMWRHSMHVDIVLPEFAYKDHVEAYMGGVQLDPHYEAKCHKYLLPSDLLWIVGVRTGL